MCIGSSGRGSKPRRNPFGTIQPGLNLIQFDKIKLPVAALTRGSGQLADAGLVAPHLDALSQTKRAEQAGGRHNTCKAGTYQVAYQTVGHLLSERLQEVPRGSVTFTKHQTLHLCRFECSRATQYYSCACFSIREAQNTTPVQVRAFTEHQTLRLCKFECSRATKHYTCAGLSAREPLDITPVHVSAPKSNQTLHLCMFESLRSTKHYTYADLSA